MTPRGIKHPHRLGVAADQHGGRRVIQRHQGCQGGRTCRRIKRDDLDVVVLNWESRCCHPLSVTQHARTRFSWSKRISGTVDQRDSPVAERDTVLDRTRLPSRVVHTHRGQFGRRRVDQDGWEPAGRQPLDEAIRWPHRDDQDTVGARWHATGIEHPVALAGPFDAADHQAVVGVSQRLFDTAQDLKEQVASDERNDEIECVGALFGEGSRDGVGLIPEPLGSRTDPCSGGGRNPWLVTQGARGRSDPDPSFPGDIVNRRTLSPAYSRSFIQLIVTCGHLIDPLDEMEPVPYTIDSIVEPVPQINVTLSTASSQ